MKKSRGLSYAEVVLFLFVVFVVVYCVIRCTSKPAVSPKTVEVEQNVIDKAKDAVKKAGEAAE